MSDDERRTGDTRPHVQEARLTLLPAHGEKIRWLPKHGDPLCILEWMSQAVVRLVAFVPVYTAIVVTLTLLVILFGPPFGEVMWGE